MADETADTDTNRRLRFAFALIFLATLSAMTLAGPLKAEHWLSGATALLWAYMLGEGAAVVATGWTVQRVEAKKAASKEAS